MIEFHTFWITMLLEVIYILNTVAILKSIYINIYYIIKFIINIFIGVLNGWRHNNLDSNQKHKKAILIIFLVISR